MSISTKIEISEAQLEEFFIRSCAERLSLGYLASQVRLSSGIADVICRQSKGVYYVVELKAEPLQAKHLAQVMGYVCELRARHYDKVIKPLLIGPSVADDHLLGCLRWFDEFPDATHWATNEASAVSEYRLYDFDALSGLNFFSSGIKQRNLEAARAESAAERCDQLVKSGRQSALDKGASNIASWRSLS
ncbi:hypothetical protein [Roseibium sp.]|uniref:hypothetical protein n=1 Tax=Roseibium sp. TaxID=1936156 RepID=UPI003B523085